jgi:protein phosphatase
MLICPQCQSENANTNKFCQGCGTPLTYKFCPECGTQVALNEKFCHNCGAQTGTVWRAIVMGVVGTGSSELPIDKQVIRVNPPSELGALEVLEAAPVRELEAVESLQSSASLQEEPEVTCPPAPLALPLTTHHSPLTTSLPAGAYLDLQQRYQLLDPLEMPSKLTDCGEAQVRVLDCQPFQLSPLEAGANVMVAQSIPAIAKTYIAFNSKSSQKLPKIHDAWQQGNQQVVLIADRSEWRELLQMWHERSTTPTQIMQWFDDMVRLWLELEPWHCCQSLLELSNLRVDATGSFGLQRLYPDPADGNLTLQDLGQIWQQLFQESQRTKFGSLVELLLDLTAGSIQTTDELRSRLQATTNELQLDADAFDSPSMLNTEQEAAADRGKVGVTLNNSAAPTVIQMNESQENFMKSDELPTLVLPMHLVGIEDAGNTDVGRQRHHNEDCFGIITKVDKYVFPNDRTIEAQGIYILCDGMGGHAGGEVASALAVKKLQEYFQSSWQPYQALPNEAAIREAIRIANKSIFDLNQQDARSGVGRMGTTLVLVLVHNNQIAVAHVGDSRLYSFSRKRGLEQVTLDHEVGQREILRGVEPAIAYARPDAYQLTQALGPRDENYVNPDVSFVELNEDTLLILVSDGVSDNGLLEQHWETHIEPLLNSGSSLERGVSELIELANQYNGHDNITVVLVRLKVRPKLEH